MRHRTLRAVSGAAALAFTVVACGQKPGVHVEGSTGGVLAQDAAVADAGDQTADGGSDDLGAGESTGADTGGDLDLDNGSDADVGAAPGDTGGETGDGSASGPSATTDQQASSTGGGSTGNGGAGDRDGATTSGNGDGSTDGSGSTSSSGQKRQVTGSDRTGVTDDKIVFGSHAPVTGAAPLPTTSFEKSGDLYWRNLVEVQGKDVLGRTKVELIFRDDKYDPNSARQVCRELAAKAFGVSGGGGTDQIQACGQFAEVAKVPYSSAGVTEAGLRDNAWYFAASMSYRQQGTILPHLVKKKFPGKKVAAIVTDTPNFDDAVQGWEAGVKQAGLSGNYYKTLRHPKGDTSWYNAFAGDLARNGVEVLYINSSPVDYIRFAQQAAQQGFTPQYVGVGITMGLNAVLGSGCDQVDGGIFLSPFPGLDWARQNVPEFFEAGRRFGAPTDDIALALWGSNEVIHLTLQRYGQVYGNDLTREDYRDLMESQDKIQGSVFPLLSYSPQDHFGGKQVHVLQANCEKEEYETLATFVSSF